MKMYYEEGFWKQYQSKKRHKLEQPVIDAQTIMFWHLQLQFMQMSPEELFSQLAILVRANLYNHNMHTRRILSIKTVYPLMYTQKDHDCLATHLALQLSGIEE